MALCVTNRVGAWHDLRHTFVSWLMMRGASQRSVAELLGHQSMKMTMRYAEKWQGKGKSDSSKDLEAILKRALEDGLPYQTLISSLLHKYLGACARLNGIATSSD